MTESCAVVEGTRQCEEPSWCDGVSQHILPSPSRKIAHQNRYSLRHIACSGGDSGDSGGDNSVGFDNNVGGVVGIIGG